MSSTLLSSPNLLPVAHQPTRYVSNVTGDWLRPRLLSLPAGAPRASFAAEALSFVDSVGYFLDPWQAFLTECTLLEQAELDQWYMREFGYLAPRQNGKGGIVTARSIIDLFLLPSFDIYGRPKPRLVVYTAHQFKTAAEAFERLKDVIEASPELMRQMEKGRNHGVRNSALDKGFDLANGNRMRYLARSRGGSGRGLSIDSLFTDECQELPRSAYDALVFTQRAVPRPQRLLTGTVPEPENNSEVWTDARDKGRGPQQKQRGWAEYSVDPDDPKTQADMTKPARFGYEVDPDLDYALATNPAFGIRVSPETLEDDVQGNASSYKREVLCYWPGANSANLLLKNWAQLHDRASQPLDPVTFAVEVAEDRSAAVIMAIAVRPDDRFHVELVDYEPGSEWIPDRLFELMDTWHPQVITLDPGGPAGPLARELEELEVPFKSFAYTELTQACSLAFDMVDQKRLAWLAHPALARAVKAAKWRTAGQGRSFERRVTDHDGNLIDVSPLMAMSMGLLATLLGSTPDLGRPAKREPQPSQVMYGFN